MRRKLGVAAGCLAAGLILSGCGGSTDVQPAPAVDVTAEPEPTVEVTAAPEPEPTVEEASVGEKLALIDGQFSASDIANYEKRIAQVSERCTEPEMNIADKIVKATQLLDERGITENNLWVMDEILQAIPPNMAGEIDCTEVLAVLISLRIGQ